MSNPIKDSYYHVNLSLFRQHYTLKQYAIWELENRNVLPRSPATKEDYLECGVTELEYEIYYSPAVFDEPNDSR